MACSSRSPSAVQPPSVVGGEGRESFLGVVHCGLGLRGQAFDALKLAPQAFDFAPSSFDVAAQRWEARLKAFALGPARRALLLDAPLFVLRPLALGRLTPLALSLFALAVRRLLLRALVFGSLSLRPLVLGAFVLGSPSLGFGSLAIRLEDLTFAPRGFAIARGRLARGLIAVAIAGLAIPRGGCAVARERLAFGGLAIAIALCRGGLAHSHQRRLRGRRGLRGWRGFRGWRRDIWCCRRPSFWRQDASR
jgi:hypothetical protein